MGGKERWSLGLGSAWGTWKSRMQMMIPVDRLAGMRLARGEQAKKKKENVGSLKPKNSHGGVDLRCETGVEFTSTARHVSVCLLRWLRFNGARS
jgi:hypothetical protein